MKYFVAIVLLVLAGCSSQYAGGSSSETTNGFISIATTAGAIHGTTESGATVTLCAIDYNPIVKSGYSAQLTVPGDGSFDFNSIPMGIYNLYAQNSGDSVLLISSIPVSLENDTSFSAAYADGGRLEGSLSESSPGSYKIFLKGSPYFTIVDYETEFAIDMLPGGTYEIGFIQQQDLIVDSSGDNDTILNTEVLFQPITITGDSTTTWPN